MAFGLTQNKTLAREGQQPWRSSPVYGMKHNLDRKLYSHLLMAAEGVHTYTMDPPATLAGDSWRTGWLEKPSLTSSARAKLQCIAQMAVCSHPWYLLQEELGRLGCIQTPHHSSNRSKAPCFIRPLTRADSLKGSRDSLACQHVHCDHALSFGGPRPNLGCDREEPITTWTPCEHICRRYIPRIDRAGDMSSACKLCK